MPTPTPPTIRTINAAQVRAGRAVRMVQQPSEVLDYAIDFTDLLPTGYTNFALGSVTYGVGSAGSSPTATAGILVVYVNTNLVSDGTDGVISMSVTCKDANAISITLTCEFTLSVRDQ